MSSLRRLTIAQAGHLYFGQNRTLLLRVDTTPHLPGSRGPVGSGDRGGVDGLGQGVLALVVDLFGLWGIPALAVSGSRLLGVVLLLVGMVLLRR
jgi:hypothetical protein